MKIISIVVCTILMIGCNIEPKAIVYGEDICSSCKMTIVDKLHAAQVVTNKGKAYSFDATECMIDFLKDTDSSSIAMYLSTDYLQPAVLIDATKATFLITDSIPSPMGANISAFKTKEEAIAMQNKKAGDIYDWRVLIELFK